MNFPCQKINNLIYGISSIQDLSTIKIKKILNRSKKPVPFQLHKSTRYSYLGSFGLRDGFITNWSYCYKEYNLLHNRHTKNKTTLSSLSRFKEKEEMPLRKTVNKFIYLDDKGVNILRLAFEKPN